VGIESVSNASGRVADPRIAREIGYWVRADSLRRGLCSEAVGVLTALAFRRADLEHVEIQCDPRNRASARVPERLGYRHVATRVANKRAPGGEPRDTMIWVMTREELDSTPAAAIVHRVSGD